MYKPKAQVDDTIQIIELDKLKGLYEEDNELFNHVNEFARVIKVERIDDDLIYYTVQLNNSKHKLTLIDSDFYSFNGDKKIYENIEEPEIEFSSDLAYLPKYELEYFLTEYNTYIQEFYDNHDEGAYPVCMAEFYNNEFQEILEDEI